MSCITNPRVLLFGGAALVIAMAAAVDRLYGQSLPTPGDRRRAADPFQATIRPLLEKHCFRCHGDVDPEGKLNLSAFRTSDDVLRDHERWQRIWRAVHTQEMPPEPPLPRPQERATLSRAIAELLREGGGPKVGEVVLRRLNQVEYNNTVLDLFGLARPLGTYDPQKGMPESVRVVLHQSSRRIVLPLPPDPLSEGFLNLGEALALPPFLLEKYLAAARQMIAKLAADEQNRAKRRAPGQANDDPTEAFAERLASSHGASGGQGARTFVAAFGRRAFRRPLTEDELDRYFSLYQGAAQRGQPFQKALMAPVAAMLVSPHFLFRVEQGVEGEDRDGLRPLADNELASRLSYFLWSTMPDEQLLRAADQGRLRDLDVLEEQARRMLRHRFSKELSEQFGLQWLGVAEIRSAMPFPDLYPQFYKLKEFPATLQQEVRLLFETILIEDRSVLDFIDPGFTWMDKVAALFYGDVDRVPDRNSGTWRRYELADKRRGGVVGMAAPMLATSLANRTSPVLRGKWVLERLLAAPPPPPPPNVNNVLDAPAAEDHLSFRERLARHRADAACASCHRRMDPIGFSLENYDAIGAWREKEGQQTIDATGEFLDGTRFHGPAELKEILLTKYRDDFLRCLTEKMLTYALGRKLDYYDAPAVAQIVENLHRDDYRFSTLVVGIVRSEPFRFMTVPEPADPRSRE